MADKRRPNGEGSVTWDESVQLWIGRLPRDERGRRAKVSDKTEAGALRKLRKKLQEREQGLAVDGRITVKAFLEQWLRDTVLPSGQADQTKEKREIAVRVHLVPGLGRVQLAKLTPAHVQRWIADELAAGKGPRTVQIAHGTLRLALEQAVLWSLVPRNVARLVKPPAYSAGEQRPFTPAEQAAILDAAQSDPLHVMVVLAQATGLRQSELLGLRWAGVDLEGRLLRVDKQLGRDGQLKTLKTAAARRALPLPSPVIDVLRQHRAEQDRQRVEAVVWEDRDLIITTRNGRPVSQRNAHRSWTRILERAGVEHRGIHHLRHAYVTMLAENGVHERVAQHLAGHADGRMTREVYTHVTQRMLEGATAVVEQAALDVHRTDRDGKGPVLGPGAAGGPAGSAPAEQAKGL